MPKAVRRGTWDDATFSHKATKLFDVGFFKVCEKAERIGAFLQMRTKMFPSYVGTWKIATDNYFFHRKNSSDDRTALAIRE